MRSFPWLNIGSLRATRQLMKTLVAHALRDDEFYIWLNCCHFRTIQFPALFVLQVYLSARRFILKNGYISGDAGK
jgi:hypothetical protein